MAFYKYIDSSIASFLININKKKIKHKMIKS